MSRTTELRADLDCLAGGGEMGALMRSIDWTASPLGPVAGWPQSLRTAVSILLNSRYPMFLFWGPHLAKLYNDGYRPILGAKHPWALGRPGPEIWPEIWDTIGPMVERVVDRAEATWSDDLLLFMHRNGYSEECYFTFSYSPIREESGGVGGMFCACTETTAKVLGERRLRTLGELAAATAEARTGDDACRRAAAVLADNPKDLPFALIYRFEEDGRRARLAAGIGVTGVTGIEGAEPEQAADPALAEIIGIGESGETDDAAWPFARLLRTGAAEVLDLRPTGFCDIPARPWPEPAEHALLLPIAARGQSTPAGALIVGISPRRELDADYQGFLELVAGQIATALANARAYEEERRRAEALAELNRAKTAFFSNVSHEFRTPLTLLLGPLDELLDGQRPGLPDPLPDQVREPLLVAQRNARRLLRLVNTLLDFSRLEAGRARAALQETDLAALTADLASIFRSAAERAGLVLEVDCPPLPEPVWVDREMWEKVVLNLLSNALKFTFEGKIEVALRAAGGNAELAVRDTGTGMPPAELPHVFERFHRIEGARGRSHEGTGIGLALVQELVRLQGGTVAVESALGRGSTFTVTVPLGRAHLPGNPGRSEPAAPASAEQDVAARARAFLEDLPDSAGLAGSAPETAGVQAGEIERAGGRILLADDNADMREYVRRLLAPGYQVETAADGTAALAAARARPPDLVLADVMMPGLDGYGLLRELRADPATARIPVVLLSARAGEEARIEGLEAGADDYLVKPFSARELLARIRSHFDLARLREQAAERERELLAETRAALQAAREAGRAKDKFLAALSHELRTPLTPVVAAVSRLERDPRFEGARRELAMIRRNVELEARLIDDLLDLTRVARGKFELHREVVDVRRVVEQALEICCGPEVLAGGRRLEVDLALAAGATGADGAAGADGSDGAGVWGDASRLTQVFWNLLSNAVKFTPPGGTIAVTARLEPAIGGPSAGELAIEVRDDGVGIEPAALPRIFDAFQQADAIDAERRGGLGLGLAISRAILSLHGGRLTAASEGPGRGACFTVYLARALPLNAATGSAEPAGEARTAPPAALNPTPDGGPGPLRLLLVEDHADTAEAMAELLRSEGHQVAVAHGLSEARALAAELGGRGGIDLVVSDLGLPDGSGLDLMRELAAGYGLKGIALSGYGMEEDRSRSREAGFARHLIKPVNPGSLAAAIREVAAS